jgi:hypothetical protein
VAQSHKVPARVVLRVDGRGPRPLYGAVDGLGLDPRYPSSSRTGGHRAAEICFRDFGLAYVIWEKRITVTMSSSVTSRL